MNTLNMGPYDPDDDSIVIEGTRYSGHFFRGPLSFRTEIGSEFRIEKHDGRTVTVTRYPNVGYPITELLAYAIKKATELNGGKIEDDFMIDAGIKLLNEIPNFNPHLKDDYGY